MHELSIAGNIVEAVEREMTARGIDRLTTIALRIGRMTDVDAEALRFGFEVITKETRLDGTKLAIEHLPIVARCTVCATEFEIPEMIFVCPSCRSTSVDLVQGTELDIAYIEVPDENTVSESNT